MKLLYYNLTGD